MKPAINGWAPMARFLRFVLAGLGLVAGWSMSLPDGLVERQGFALITSATAQTGGDYRLENVSFSFGPVRYEAKRI
jgi:hypothetical protein